MAFCIQSSLRQTIRALNFHLTDKYHPKTYCLPRSFVRGLFPAKCEHIRSVTVVKYCARLLSAVFRLHVRLTTKRLNDWVPLYATASSLIIIKITLDLYRAETMKCSKAILQC